jgi:hypothetical protein
VDHGHAILAKSPKIELMFDLDVITAAPAPRPEDVEDDELVELIQAWERLAAWSAAGQLAAIAELARRRPRSLADGHGGAVDAGDPTLPEVSEFAVDEVAAALRLSRPAAGARLHLAVELSRLPATAAALAGGAIDVPRARAVVDAVTVLDAPLAAAVEQQVLPRAGQQTAGQLRSALSRAVLSADPAAAEVRHERALAGRQVTLQSARDGMAELWALLPADAAVAVYQRIDSLARRSGADDARSRDARRADALVAAVLGPAVDTRLGLRPSLAGAPDPPGSPDPGAPVLAGATVPVPVPIDTVAPVLAGAFDPPGSPDPRAPLHGAATVPVPVPIDTVAPVLAGATVHVTVPVDTALGVGTAPGELSGYGPVPGSLARRLAARGSWRRTEIDPATGVIVAVGRERYTPSAALADLVRARDRTCRFPGCRQPSRRCDLDHVIPWPAGPTTAGNLAALCRHHHRLKHQTAWAVRAGPGAELEWTSPAGHRYVTTPT